MKGRRGDVVAAAFEALFSDPVGQGDPAGAENVVEVTLGNVMRGGDLGRAEMRVVQMCAGVLQDPQRQCRFQCILAESGGVEVGGDDLPPVPRPSRRPTFSNFVMPTPNTDDANLVDLPVSALLFAPGRHPGQVIGAVPGDRRARRVQGGELGGGQGDRQRAKVLLDA